MAMQQGDAEFGVHVMAKKNVGERLEGRPRDILLLIFEKRQMVVAGRSEVVVFRAIAD
jgi:hypothetical protein